MHDEVDSNAVDKEELLNFTTLGAVALDYAGARINLQNRKARALFAYLALSDTGEEHRDRLVDLLWSEAEQNKGRGSLRQAMYETSKALQAAGFDQFKSNKLTASVNKEALRIDIDDVLEQASNGEVHFLLLGEGPFLDTLLAELETVDPAFSTWLREKRQSLHNLLVSYLEGVLPDAATTPDSKAELIAKAVSRLDQTNETAARVQIRARAMGGDLGSAFGIYTALWNTLETDFDIEPSLETQELIAQIRMTQPAEAIPPTTTEWNFLPSPGDGRPSVAVLPYRDLSPIGETRFGDGIVHNVIQALAALKELFVIERGSTLDFRDQDLDLRAVGRELSVRYILHGSVQRSGDHLRIHSELVDAENSEVVHVVKHGGKINDIFELQDAIALETVKSIAPNVRQRELDRALKKHPQNMTAYDLVVQALEPLYELEYPTFSRARGLLQKAITLDPNYATALSYAARWHSLRVGQEWSPDVAGDIREAIRLSTAAIRIDETDALALTIYGYQQAYLGNHFEVGFDCLDRAMSLCPNLALAWTYSSALLCFLSNGPEAVRRAETGLRLSPIGRHAFFAEHILAQAHYVNTDYAEAIRWARIADSHNSRLTSNVRTLISSLVATGMLDEAKDAARRHQKIAPSFRILEWAARTPMNEKLTRNRIEELRAAGLPD